jgi:molecular chaperone GrpE (heat shock protein)
MKRIPEFLITGDLPIILSGILIVVGILIVFLVTYGRMQATSIQQTQGLVDNESAQSAQLDSIRKEHNRLRQFFEGLADSLNLSNKEIHNTVSGFSSQQGEIRTLREERAELSQRVEDIENALIHYLRDLDRISRNTEIDTVKKAAVRDDFNELARIMKPFGLAVIYPEQGEEFNSRIHNAITSEASDSGAANTIVRCESAGYMVGRRVAKRADVVVVQ